jgi:predicted dehydrogenase
MDPVQVAVVGLGRVSRSHIDGLSYWPESCELAAVVDVDAARAQAFANEFEVPYYTSTEEAYADPGIDAVVLCLPHHQHAPEAVAAAEAGKHVPVEKVLARPAEEVRTMVEAADQYDVRLMGGQRTRFCPALQRAKAPIEGGATGKPSNLMFTYAFDLTPETVPEWWVNEENTGGLVYPLLGSHTVDYTLWTLADRDPVSVYAHGGTEKPEFGGDDYASLIIGFDDGTHSTNIISYNCRPPVGLGLVMGTAGSIRFVQSGVWDGELVGTGAIDLYVNGDVVETPTEPHAFARQMKEFVDAIHDKHANNVHKKIDHHFHGWWSFVVHGMQGEAVYLALAGVVVAWFIWIRNPHLATAAAERFRPIHRVLEMKYGFDELYRDVIAAGSRKLGWGLFSGGDQRMIDGWLVNGSARLVGYSSTILRRLQTGYLYHYAFAMILGLLVGLTWILFR